MTSVNDWPPLPLSPQNDPHEQRVQLLDDPTEWAAFSCPEKTEPGCWRSSVVFEGMHCAACAITLEDVLRAVPGVVSVHISGASHRGQIVWSPAQTRPSQWMRSVERHGYKAVPANDALARQQPQFVGWPLVVFTRPIPGRWRLGYSCGRFGTRGCVGLGIVDGSGPRSSAMVRQLTQQN